MDEGVGRGLGDRIPLDHPTGADRELGEVADGVAADRGLDGTDRGLAALDTVDEVPVLGLALVEGGVLRAELDLGELGTAVLDPSAIDAAELTR